MQVRWSPAAADDLAQIVDYILSDSLDSAQRVAQAIYDRAGTLATNPYLGRRGRALGELVNYRCRRSLSSSSTECSNALMRSRSSM
jgi:plasmid stabilization system protein ParE